MCKWGIVAVALLIANCTSAPESGNDASGWPAECQGVPCLEQWACKEALWWLDHNVTGFTCSGDKLLACHDVFTPVPGDCCAKDCECEPVQICSAGCEENVIGDPCCIEDETCVHGLGTEQPCCDGQGLCRNPDSLYADGVHIDLLRIEALQDTCMAGEICFTSWFAGHPQTSDTLGPWPACVSTSNPDATGGGRCVPECSQTARNRMQLLESEPDYKDFPALAQDDCASGLVCIPCAYTIRGKERETGVCKLPPLE